MKNKLAIFEDYKIRRVYDETTETWYFSVVDIIQALLQQTRRLELIEKRLEEQERLTARQKLSVSEKELSGLIFERIGDNSGFARIRSKGDAALFGGNGNALSEPHQQLPA